MANTVHGPYLPTSWVNGSTPANATNMNHLESQNGVALASFNPDLIGAAFIDGTGVACVKDATTASQLNVTSGKAYLLMTDGTNARIDIAATTFSSSGHPSTTLYLDLNPDGSWSWGTTHSAVANHLTICSLTTDGSSNISAVTDARVTSAQLLAALAQPSVAQPGGLALPSPLKALLTQSAALAGGVNGGVTFGQTGALRGSMDGAALFASASVGKIDVPNTSLPTGNAAWTLEAWFKTSTTAANQFILSMGPNTTKAAALLYIGSSNKLVGDLDGSAITSTATYTDGAWHHAAFTWDGTTGTLYADGASVASSGALGPNALVQSFPLGIGYQSGFGSNYFNGTLDECAVYGTALSSARITAHYNAALSTTSDAYAATVLADAPLRYLRLGDAVGSAVAVDTISPTASTLANADGTLNVVGVSGQPSAGSFGVPVIVAQAIRTHVTTIGSNVTILSFTPGATGLYRVNGYVLMQDSAARALGFFVTWTDPDLNSALSEWLAAPGGVSGFTIQAFNNSNTWNNNVPFGAFSAPFMAKAGAAIIVSYQHDTGTANDFVTALIERLA